MKLATIGIVLELTGPVLTAASTSSEPGMDSPFARNAKGEPCYPYSLVKGKLKEAWAGLKGLPDVTFLNDLDRWFPRGPSEGVWDPDRGDLHFADFVCPLGGCASGSAQPGQGPAAARKTSTGIRMDRKRKAGEEGAIQVSERLFEAGASADFGGGCWFFAKDDTAIDSVMADLGLLFARLTSLGADRTAGLGAFRGARVDTLSTSVVEIPDAPDPAQPPSEIVSLTFKLLDPFCLAQKHLTRYFFEGSEIITGGALKGTLASMVLEMLGKKGHALDDTLPGPWGVLGKHLHEIRFTHAFPSEQGKRRPDFPPLSLVKFGKKPAEDVALWDEPDLGTDEEGRPCAPAFRIDWKDASDVLDEYGWPRLPRELRGRHEHDPHTRRAKDEQFFVYESVAPRPEVDWRASVDLSGVLAEDRPQVWGCLAALLKLGFHGIGKSKARSEPVTCGALESEPVVLVDGLYIVTLQTAALLCEPKDKEQDDAELGSSYKDVWEELSKDENGRPALELVRFFARQSLEGGYLGRRFQETGAYNPFLLTSAGSVFVLKPATGMEEEAARRVAAWRDHGLPLPAWVDRRYGRSWKTNPFLPENGYGEIAVNLDCHKDKKALPWKEAAGD